MSVSGFIGGAVGTALGGPGGAAAGATAGNALPGILSRVFGGAGRDAQRQARVDLMKRYAIDYGSVIAMQVILAGPANVAGNEDPMWMRAADEVRAARPDVYNAAVNARPYWDSSDNDSMDKTRAKIGAEIANSEMQQFGTPGVTTLPLVTSTATAIPPMQQAATVPTAGVSPVLLAVAALVLLLVGFLVLRRRGG